MPDHSVDHAVLVKVFLGIPDRPAMVREIGNVLRQGGSVHVVDHPKTASEGGPPLQGRRRRWRRPSAGRRLGISTLFTIISSSAEPRPPNHQDGW
ncbi:MAG: hypothetical protein AB7E27_03500 [Candidatus Methanomethylophilaceae archaeon]